MSTSAEIERVAPIGTTEATALVCSRPGRSQMMTHELPVYPASPEGQELRRIRIELGISIRQAAELLGISAVMLGQLERGASRYKYQSDWSAARVALRRYARTQESAP